MATGHVESTIDGQSLSQRVLKLFFAVPVVLQHAKCAMACRVAEVEEKTGVLPGDFPVGGPAICVWSRGEGKVPGFDALTRDTHRLSGDFLMPDVQSLAQVLGGSTEGRYRVYGLGTFEAVVGD